MPKLVKHRLHHWTSVYIIAPLDWPCWKTVGPCTSFLPSLKRNVCKTIHNSSCNGFIKHEIQYLCYRNAELQLRTFHRKDHPLTYKTAWRQTNIRSLQPIQTHITLHTKYTLKLVLVIIMKSSFVMIHNALTYIFKFN